MPSPPTQAKMLPAGSASSADGVDTTHSSAYEGEPSVDFSGAAELLNPMVVQVRDVDVAGGVERDAQRRVELPVQCSEAAPLSPIVTVGGELLDAVIEAVRDVHVSDGVDGDADRIVELTVPRAEAAPLVDVRA